MRVWINRVLRVGFVLAFFWIAGYVAWSAAARHDSWKVLAARGVGVLAFGQLLLLGWPPLRKPRGPSYLLIGICWASLGADVWLEHRDRLGLTLGVILTLIYVFLSWMEWKTGNPSPDPADT